MTPSTAFGCSSLHEFGEIIERKLSKCVGVPTSNAFNTLLMNECSLVASLAISARPQKPLLLEGMGQNTSRGAQAGVSAGVGVATAVSAVTV